MADCPWVEMDFDKKASITKIEIKGWTVHGSISKLFHKTKITGLGLDVTDCWTESFLLMYFSRNVWQYYNENKDLQGQLKNLQNPQK